MVKVFGLVDGRCKDAISGTLSNPVPPKVSRIGAEWLLDSRFVALLRVLSRWVAGPTNLADTTITTPRGTVLPTIKNNL